MKKMMRRMTRRTRGVVIVAGAALCLAAYVSATYILDPAVQDSGGGRAASSSYRLDASIGGPVIAATAGGTASSASYKLEVNSMGLLEGPAKAPSTGGGGCVPGGGAPLGILVFLAFALPRRAPRKT